jgi:hypothetical protein
MFPEARPDGVELTPHPANVGVGIDDDALSWLRDGQPVHPSPRQSRKPVLRHIVIFFGKWLAFQ